MKRVTTKSTKMGLRIGIAACATILVALTSIGIYFAFKKSPQPVVSVNPLAFSIDSWDGTSNSTNWLSGNEFANRGEKTYTIDSAESFAYFVDITNSESRAENYNYFKDYTVYLNNSIDLNGLTIGSIGKKVDDHSTFQGTFDGGYYTIMNGNINGDGLFGYVENATIKNVGLYNCNINGTSSYVGGLVGEAIDTDIQATYVRLGSINGSSRIGGLVGMYKSTSGTHNIRTSFVDTVHNGNGLIGYLHTDDSVENEVAIRNCYYTYGEKSLSTNNEDNIIDKSIKPTSIKDFKSWDYGVNKTWCKYDYMRGSTQLSFNYPILSSFNKVFKKGSFYEGISYNQTTGEAISTENIATALNEIGNGEEGSVTLIVEKVWTDEKIITNDGATVTIASQQDCEIIRSSGYKDDMIVATEGSTLILGSEGKTLTINGDKDTVKKYQRQSGALVVASGKDFVVNGKVVLENNINNATSFGGAISLYNLESATEDTKQIENLEIKNCEAKNGGAISVIGGKYKLSNGKITNCKATNGGGLFAVSDATEYMTNQDYVAYSRYTNGKNVSLMATTSGRIERTEIDISYYTFTSCKSDENGGAICGEAIDVGNCRFENCSAGSEEEDDGTVYYTIYIQHNGYTNHPVEVYNNETDERLYNGDKVAEGTEIYIYITTEYDDEGWYVSTTGGDVAGNDIYGYDRYCYVNSDFYIDITYDAPTNYYTVTFPTAFCKVYYEDEGFYISSGAELPSGSEITIYNTSQWYDDPPYYLSIWGEKLMPNYSSMYILNRNLNITYGNADFANTLYNHNNSAELESTVLTATRASYVPGYGGAIYVGDSDPDLSYEDMYLYACDSIFINNTAYHGDGGAIYGEYIYDFTSSANTYQSNRAVGAGVLSVMGYDCFLSENDNFYDNYADDNGVMYLEQNYDALDASYIIDATFEDNRTSSNSGTDLIHLYDYTSVELNGCLIYDNMCGFFIFGSEMENHVLFTWDTRYVNGSSEYLVGYVSSLNINSAWMCGSGLNLVGVEDITIGGVNGTNRDVVVGCEYTYGSLVEYAANNTLTYEDIGNLTINCGTFFASAVPKEFLNSGTINAGSFYNYQGFRISKNSQTLSNFEFYNCSAQSSTLGSQMSAGGVLYITAASSSTVTLNNCLFYNCSTYSPSSNYGNYGAAAGAVGVSGNSKLVLNDCEFVGCSSTVNSSSSSSYGGAIYGYFNTIEATNTIFKSNTASNGGAIYANNLITGTFTNCSFINNVATADGAFIYHNNTSANKTLTFDGGVISGNACPGNIWGGDLDTLNLGYSGIVAVYQAGLKAKTVNINAAYIYGASTFSGVTTWNVGKGNISTNQNVVIGGYYDNQGNLVKSGTSITMSGTVNIAKGTFIGNTNRVVSITSGQTATITGGIFKENTGGAIKATGGTLSVSGAQYTGNSTTDSGGAIWVSGKGTTFNLANTNSFDGNSAQYGGAICWSDMGYDADGEVIDFDYTFNNMNFTNNSAQYGGAVFIDDGWESEGEWYRTIDINGGTWANNTATDAGGAICLGVVNVLELTISAGYFYGNTAVNGGVIYSTIYDNDYWYDIRIGTDSSTKQTLVFGGMYENGKLYVEGNTASNNGGVIYLSKGSLEGGIATCNLTIKNAGFYNNSATGSGGVVYQECRTNLTATNAEFKENSATGNGGVICQNDASDTAALTDCTFQQNSAQNGGVLGATNTSVGKVIVTRGTYKSNSAKNDGGVFNAKNVTINSGTFNQNQAGYGGVVCAESSSGKVDIVTGVFSGNYAWNGSVIWTAGPTYIKGGTYFENGVDNVGGVICANSSSSLSITGGTFNTNFADNGGVIWTQCDVTISNSTFTNNTATDDTGGVIYACSDITISNSTFTNNTASLTGGAIYAESTVTITGSANFTENSAEDSVDSEGGAIYADNGVTITGDNNVFEGNSACYGGAIESYGEVTITGNTTFTNNYAFYYGAAIESSDVTTISNSTFTGHNTSYYHSGGTIYAGDDMTISNSTFTNNTATKGSVFYSTGVATFNNSTFNDAYVTTEKILEAKSLIFNGCNFKNPSKDEYVFAGYSTDNDAIFECAASSSSTTVTTGACSGLYAVWKTTNGTHTRTGYLTHTFNDYASHSFTSNSQVTYTYNNDTIYWNYNVTTSYNTEDDTTANNTTYSNLTFPTNYAVGTSYSINNGNFYFKGWSTGNDTVTEWTSGTKSVSSATTWYAVWSKTWKFYDTSSSAPSYAVNYVYNASGSQTYSKTNPTNTGFTFVGYSTAADAVAETNKGTSTTSVTSNSANPIFYAVWSGNVVTSTGKTSATSNYGDTITISFKTGSGSAVADVTAYRQTYYKYDTGYYNQNHSYDLTKHSGSETNKTTTTYYRLVNNGTNGSWSTTIPTLTTTINYPTSTLSGFNFVGWATSGTSTTASWTSGSKAFTANTTWYAVWSKTWKFYDTSSSAPSYAVNYVYNASASQTYTKANPTLSGFTFVGYSTAADAVAETNKGNSTTSVTSSSVNPIFYAVWSKTWKFYDTSSSAPSQTVNYVYNASASQTYAKANPTLSGYEFVGYSIDDDYEIGPSDFAKGTSSTSVTSSNANPTLYAIWKKDLTNSGTLTHEFYTNTNTKLDNKTTNITYNTVTNYYNYDLFKSNNEIPSITGYSSFIFPTATRTGYNFVGWTDNSTSKTASYVVGDEYTPTTNTKWYAVWSRTWKIYYTVDRQEDIKVNYPYDTSDNILYRKDDITNIGFNFVGLSTGNDNIAEFNKSGDATTVTSSLANPIFYAVWSKKYNFDTNGDGVYDTTEIAYYPYNVTNPATYTTSLGGTIDNFVGWELFDSPITASISGAGSTGLWIYKTFAHVVPNQTYEITLDKAILNSYTSATAPTGFTVRIHDFDNNNAGVYENLSFGENLKTTLTYNTDKTSNDVQIIIYAGIMGETAGNIVSFENVKITVLNTPSNEITLFGDYIENNFTALCKRQFDDATVKFSGSGEVVYGSTLSAVTNGIPEGTTTTYEWFYTSTNATTGGTKISNTTNKFEIGTGYIGKYIYCKVTLEKEGYITKTLTAITSNPVAQRAITVYSPLNVVAFNIGGVNYYSTTLNAGTLAFKDKVGITSDYTAKVFSTSGTDVSSEYAITRVTKISFVVDSTNSTATNTASISFDGSRLSNGQETYVTYGARNIALTVNLADKQLFKLLGSKDNGASFTHYVTKSSSVNNIVYADLNSATSNIIVKVVFEDAYTVEIPAVSGSLANLDGVTIVANNEGVIKVDENTYVISKSETTNNDVTIKIDSNTLTGSDANEFYGFIVNGEFVSNDDTLNEVIQKSGNGTYTIKDTKIESIEFVVKKTVKVTVSTGSYVLQLKSPEGYIKTVIMNTSSTTTNNLYAGTWTVTINNATGLTQANFANLFVTDANVSVTVNSFTNTSGTVTAAITIAEK